MHASRALLRSPPHRGTITRPLRRAARGQHAGGLDLGQLRGELALATDQIPRLAAKASAISTARARAPHHEQPRARVLYLARGIASPAEAAQIKALRHPGRLHLRASTAATTPRARSPGTCSASTNVDDAGQEGLELAFDHWLAGEDGAKRVIQDRYGRIVQNVESIRPARPGKDLVAVDRPAHPVPRRTASSRPRSSDGRARAGSVVVHRRRQRRGARDGEPARLQPATTATRSRRRPTATAPPPTSSSPAPRSSRSSWPPASPPAKYDNHSIIDTLARLLQSRRRRSFEDEHNLGAIDIATVLAKSSNVGMAHIALIAAAPGHLEHAHASGLRAGDDQRLPGRVGGPAAQLLALAPDRHRHHVARLYGLSVTPLQLAHAYATSARFGVTRPVSFLRVDGTTPASARARRARMPRTARHARVGGGRRGHRQARGHSGYRVSGKTGTAWKATAGGYSTDRYMAVFGGVAPATASAAGRGGGDR